MNLVKQKKALKKLLGIILAIMMFLPVLPMITAVVGAAETTRLVTFISFPDPAAGKYPASMYKYASNTDPKCIGYPLWNQTIDWYPAISSTFLPDTSYTATVTLAPGTADISNTDLNTVAGLPEVGGNVLSVTKDIVGENIVAVITYAPTGSSVTPFRDFDPSMLLFYDDFCGSDRVDTTKWDLPDNYLRQGSSGWNPEQVSIRPDPANPSNNQCVITAARASTVNGRNAAYLRDKYNYTGNLNRFVEAGCIRTRDRFQNAYGYYETRIKVDYIPGVWSAFWMYDDMVGIVGDGGIDGVEIDVIETIFSRYDTAYNSSSTLHYDGYGADHKQFGDRHDNAVRPNIYDGQFHTLGMDWSPTEYIYYIDDIEVMRMDRIVLEKNNTGVCRNPVYIKLSTESADWGNAPLESSYTSSEFIIDYVAVYDQPKHIQRDNLADDCVRMDIKAVYNEAEDKWELKADFTNAPGVSGPQSGTVTFNGETQTYTTPAVKYFDIDSGAITGISEKLTAVFTAGGHEGWRSTKFGAVEAMRTSTALTLTSASPDLSEAVWAAATPIDFSKATKYNDIRPEVTAAGKLAWDDTYLYVGVVVNTPDKNQPTNSNGIGLVNGDNLMISVDVNGFRREVVTAIGTGVNTGTLGAALNAARMWTTSGTGIVVSGNTGTSVNPANSVAGIISWDASKSEYTYKIGIRWSYLGVTNAGALDNADIKIALLISDKATAVNGGNTSAADPLQRRALSYFDGIMGPKGLGMGSVRLAVPAIEGESTVTFEDGFSGAVLDEVTVNSGKPVGRVRMPENPVREGWLFAGWYTQINGAGTKFDELTKVNANITVYARWVYAESTVIFEDGLTPGTVLNEVTIDKGTLAGSAIGTERMPEDPYREDYMFAGWYTQINGAGTKFEASTIVSADTLTVYARWVYATSTVTFRDGLSSGEVWYEVTIDKGAPAGSAIGTERMPEDPYREGFLFAGWYTQINGAGTILNAYTVVSADTLTVYARWVALDHNWIVNGRFGTGNPGTPNASNWTLSSNTWVRISGEWADPYPGVSNALMFFEAGTATASQTVNGIPDGIYELTFWYQIHCAENEMESWSAVVSGPGFDEARYDGELISGWNTWYQQKIIVEIRGGAAAVTFRVNGDYSSHHMKVADVSMIWVGPIPIKPELVSISATVSNTNLQNNANVTITVEEHYSDGSSAVAASASVKLKQNGTQTVKVGGYDVTVVVNGNNKITECYVGSPPAGGGGSQGGNSQGGGGNSQK